MSSSPAFNHAGPSRPTAYEEAAYWLLLSGSRASLHWYAVGIPLTRHLRHALLTLPADQWHACPASGRWFREWYDPSSRPAVWTTVGPGRIVPAQAIHHHRLVCQYVSPLRWIRDHDAIGWAADPQGLSPNPLTTQFVPCAWLDEVPVHIAEAVGPLPCDPDGFPQPPQHQESAHGHRKTR